jgi:predicted transcriptional regulator
MDLNTLIKNLGLQVNTRDVKLDRAITGAYVSDLLSDVIANAKEGNLWLTLQVHPNIIAVATLKELSGIILVNGRLPEEETLKKAEEENIPLLTSKLSAFQVAGKLYQLIGEC